MRSLVMVSSLMSAVLALAALPGCRSDPERIEVEVEPVAEDAADDDVAPVPRGEGGPPVGRRGPEAPFDRALEADGPRWRPSTEELPAATPRAERRATRVEAIERLDDLEEPAELEPLEVEVADAPPAADAPAGARDREPPRASEPPLQPPPAEEEPTRGAVGRGRWEEPRSRVRELEPPEPLPELDDEGRGRAFGEELEREDLEDLRRRVAVENGRETEEDGLAWWAVIVAIGGGLLAGAAAVFLWVRTHGPDAESA